MTAPTSPLLALDRVSHRFPVGRGFSRRRWLRAVDDVSLAVRKGEIHGIVGESGCGKTTLSKIMLGLLRPSDGRVLLGGRALADHGRLELAGRIQLVFQDPYSSLNPRRSVGAILAQPLKVHGIGDAAERARRIRQVLDRVGLPQRALDGTPRQLSGGQRQRVVIARALILEPEVLICDEPTSALDVSVQAQILNLLLDLRNELGLTLVIISHNLGVIAHISTQVSVMYLGRIVETGDTEALFCAPAHPYTKVLLRSVMTPLPGGGIPDLHLGPVPSPLDVPGGCRFHTRCPDAMPICRTQAPPAVIGAAGMAECHFADHATQADRTA